MSGNGANSHKKTSPKWGGQNDYSGGGGVGEQGPGSGGTSGDIAVLLNGDSKV